MGAEPDVPSPPPPPPEPTMSPEPEIPDHDHRNWKADMMSALGESVSFGRFLSEPLDWGKWSAFAHNRYLEEAARQSQPGSVAQRKAFFEAHYARKRKIQADAGDGEDEGGLEAAERTDATSSSSSSADSSCMTDEAPREETCVAGGDGDAADCGGAAVADVPQQQLEAITDAVASSFSMDGAADKACIRQGGVQVGEAVRGPEEPEKQDFCNHNSVAVDAVEKQPLQEIPIANQDVTDSVKKRRLHMSSLLQKPVKVSSPPSEKKGQSSSVKRRSLLHSAKENTSPSGTGSSKQTATSVPRKRSTTLAALHMSMSFTRCETGNAASSKRNISTTIAERISQLESASRPVENTQPQEFRPPTKILSGALSETAPKTPQVDQQRSSHVMRVKEKLFGSTSPSLHQKTSVTKEKEKKLNNEPGHKESRQSFCFKARPLPNFYRKNKQAKDSSQQWYKHLCTILRIERMSYSQTTGVLTDSTALTDCPKDPRFAKQRPSAE
ncbi:hypothetical protein ACP70R_020647 [Stipagrostis hirtigluma subsp. patula]